MSTRLASQSWPSRAACLGQDTERWFPAGSGDGDPHAKATCARCPVLIECREWALGNPQLASCGVWGGMTEPERHSERRRRQCRGEVAA